uniref:7TM GPCR serpentine receptor class x (Srx) domain-containing protein n=1 Tax=Panagrolaimus sp. PS1159 TaxID=55785 RepID=A0AC35FUH7_9BILA
MELTSDDLFAGISMIFIGIIGILLHGIEYFGIRKLYKQFIGFRLILGQKIIDILLLYQFGIWPGIVCLTKNTLIPIEYKEYAHVYLDTTWFSMCYLTVLISFSRLICVIFPVYFRQFGKKQCYICFAIACGTAFLQSVGVHTTSWFVSLFYDPEVYGTTGDFKKHQNGGTATYYFITNGFVMITYLLVYSVIAFTMIVRRKLFKNVSGTVTTNTVINIKGGGNPRRNVSSNSVEIRLMISCIASALLFITGQFLINGGLGQSKWTGYYVMLIFSLQALTPPIFRLIFSNILRKEILTNIKKCLLRKNSPSIVIAREGSNHINAITTSNELLKNNPIQIS